MAGRINGADSLIWHRLLAQAELFELFEIDLTASVLNFRSDIQIIRPTNISSV